MPLCTQPLSSQIQYTLEGSKLLNLSVSRPIDSYDSNAIQPIERILCSQSAHAITTDYS